MSTVATRVWKGAVAGFGLALLLQFLLVAAVIGRALWLARTERATGIGFTTSGLREFAVVALAFALIGAVIGTIAEYLRRKRVD